jgi:hypothetical protein
VPLEYVCPERDLPGKGKIRDISVSGMYVEQRDHDLDLGDLVRAPLWLLSEGTTVFLEGSVVRAEPGGFAVRFQGMDSRTEEALRQVLPQAEERARSRRKVTLGSMRGTFDERQALAQLLIALAVLDQGDGPVWTLGFELDRAHQPHAGTGVDAKLHLHDLARDELLLGADHDVGGAQVDQHAGGRPTHAHHSAWDGDRHARRPVSVCSLT